MGIAMRLCGRTPETLARSVPVPAASPAVWNGTDPGVPLVA